MATFILALAFNFLVLTSAQVEPNYTLYHSTSMLLQDVAALTARHPSTMSLEVKRLNLSGYVAEVQVVTVANSVQTTDIQKRPRILLNFGQHGRELITSEVALRLLQILSGEHGSPEPKLQQILDSTIIKIIPLENQNGRIIVENGSLCERRNGRGVDTNRNWDLNWGKKEKDYDPAEEYPGTGPFSEPEAKILHLITRDFKPHLWVNVHSGMQALFMPYDHKNTTPSDGSEKPMEVLLQNLNKIHCGGECIVGSGGSLVGYLAHGTATDYVYEVLKVPLAFTFEIYGDVKADYNDCFRMFNPTTSELFEDVVSNWSLLFITLASNLQITLNDVWSIQGVEPTGRKFRHLLFFQAFIGCSLIFCICWKLNKMKSRTYILVY